MGRNRTGPPCSVGGSTAHARGPAAADHSRAQAAGPPARQQRYRRRQTTGDADRRRRQRQTIDASKQNNTGPLCGPVITLNVDVNAVG